MTHYIKKQVMQLLVDPSLDAFGLQQTASNYYWSEIVPVLGRIFDELSAEGETMRLDKLELDLGMLTDESLRTAMKQELYAVLRRQVEDALLRPDRSQQFPVERESGAEHALRQWWYYMEHGRLHWGQSAPTAEWYREVLAMLSVDHGAISRLKEAFRKDTRLLMRVCAQHGKDFLETLAGILVAERQEGLANVVEEVVRMSMILSAMADGRETDGSEGTESKVNGGDLGGRKMGVRKKAALRVRIGEWTKRRRDYLGLTNMGRREAIWRMVLRQAVEQPSTFRSGGGVRLPTRWFWGGDLLLPKLLREAGVVSALPDVVTNEVEPVSDAEMEGVRVDKAKRMPAGKQSTTEKKGKKSTKERKTAAGREKAEEREQVAGEVTETNIRRNEDVVERESGQPESGRDAEGLLGESDVDEEGMYVPHAGVILLHPFLSTCFSRLQWWGGGQFAEGARQKAVMLVHWMATGSEEAPEYELVLPKVLCGSSPEAPMPGRAELNAGDYLEAEELLQMVLVRWDKLKSSSIEGLREGFLQRPGKLFRRNDRLVLQVEAHAIDILLDYLPWNLSLVKLPWLEEILFVEWR